MNRLVVAAMLSALSLSVAAGDNAERIAQSKAVVKDFMGQLKGELQRAMKAGGPNKAIEVCNTVAPLIAKSESDKHGWTVGRTSLRVRNPDNAPDAWEQKVLEQFERRKAEGEDVAAMAYAEVVEQDGGKAFRFMKAIPTGEVCLKCHGTAIDDKLKTKLDSLYPADQARGFKLGDIRGAFTITQPM